MVGESSSQVLRRRMLVGGIEVDGAAEPLSVVNPSTGRVIAEVQCAAPEDVDHAVDVAQSAFDGGIWRDLPIQRRARTLQSFANLLEEHLEELYLLETLNNGRPIRETRAQLARLPEWYQYNAALLLADRTSVVPMVGPYHSYTQRFPLGVVGILSSFNHPLMIASKSLAPALATGNSVVLKPSELTPLTALAVGHLALEAGIPPGVLNIVPGRGAVAGARLAAHPSVAKVVFTGGTEAGRSVATAAAGRFARSTVELGGKTPVIVFPDAPVETAAQGAAFAAFIGAGQTCIAGSRFLVHEDLYDEFVKSLGDMAGRIRLGDPSDPRTQLGPVISSGARTRILSIVETAVLEGASLISGGRAATVDGFADGFFVEPTVLGGVTNDMSVARTEIFGPVAVVIPFRTEAEAIAMANDSPYGLGAGIWTQDVARAHRVASKLEFGIVWVNDHHRLDPSSPWGGLRDSGMGREGGWESFHDFTHIRAVTVRTAEGPIDWYGSEDQERLN